MKLDKIEKEIQSHLKIICRTALKKSLSDKEWTAEILLKIGNLGKSKGYNICASSTSAGFEPEWLFDLTWYKYNDDLNQLKIPLILESEWNKSFTEIKHDFEKLLIARADHRIMIFQGKGDSINETISKLIEGVKSFSYSQVGDRYLFVAYNIEIKKFEFQQYTYSPTG